MARFCDMSPKYQEDVNKKLTELEHVSEGIYHDLRSIFRGGGYVLSLQFRKKGLDRIVEKDISDYAGRRSYKTQVKDLFAARLCPSRHDPIHTDGEVKDEMQNKIYNFYDGHSKITSVTVENKFLKNGMNVRYFVFNGHIELQILTLNEYNILEDTHKEYEERRTRGATSAKASDAKVAHDNRIWNGYLSL